MSVERPLKFNILTVETKYNTNLLKIKVDLKI